MTLHRSGSHPPTVTWAQLVALPADDCGPYRINGHGEYARDPRNGLWVPAEIVAGSTWTYRTLLDSDTNPASLPAGWTVTAGALSGGGGGGPLVLTVAAGGNVVLTYTPVLSGTDKICIVLKAISAPVTTGATYNDYFGVTIWDTRVSQYFNNNLYNAYTTEFCRFQTGSQYPPVTKTLDDCVMTIPIQSSGDSTILDVPSGVCEFASMPVGLWSAFAVASNKAPELVLSNLSGGVAATAAIYHCAVYTGGV
jgi:hypothetical protein